MRPLSRHAAALLPLLLLAVPLLLLAPLAEEGRGGQAGAVKAARPAPEGDRKAAGALLDRLHAAAAAARAEEYFGCYAPDAVFFGTDPSERWTLPAFRKWAAPHFAGGRGWTFKVHKRHLFFHGDTGWFDESLTSAHYGVCRGTGVVRRLDAGWRVVQYNLSIPVPDGLVKNLVRRIRRQPVPETRVFILRHAEKAAVPGERDPALSPAGAGRARRLAAMLRSLKLDAAYATQYRRTRQTVAPAAGGARLPVTTVPAGREQQLAGRLQTRHRGQTVLVSGHSNTVPALLRHLGVSAGVTLGHDDYDHLFLVTLREGEVPSFLHLRFPE